MKVLMVKTSSLGDIIHAFPVINYLHEEFPGIIIDWVIEKSFSEIVKAHPLVRRVIEMDTKGWRKNLLRQSSWKEMLAFRKKLRAEQYDVVIDLQGNTKSSIPTFLARSKHKLGFGSKTIHEWPNLWVTRHRFNPPLNLNVRDENLYVVQHYFGKYRPISDEKIILNLTSEQQIRNNSLTDSWKNEKRKKILICPGSAWKNKQVSPEALEEFLSLLQKNFDVMINFAVGSQIEKDQMEAINNRLKGNVPIFDRLPLPVLQNLMAKMDLVIAMDSLPLHLAATTGVPTFSIFGASSANKYAPKGAHHLSIQGTCPYGQIFERRCSQLRSCPTGLCIRGISGEEMYEKFLGHIRHM